MLRKWILPGMIMATLAAAPAFAEEDGGWLADSNFSGNVAITSDYVWRGISQTDRNWAIQGGLDYAAPVGLYVGTWASNVSFGGGIEMDFYGGFANELEMGLSYDVGANYYAYPKAHDGETELNFYEVYLKLGYALPAMGSVEPSVGVGYSYSPDFFGEDGSSHYLNGSLSLTLPAGFSLSGEVGYLDVEGDETTGDGGGLDGDDGFDYVHYRVGAGYSFKGLDFDLSYHAMNEKDFAEDYSGFSKAGDGKVVFTVSRSL